METKIVSITPMMAAELLTRNKNNRQLRERVVDYYADMLRRGQWMLNGQSIVIGDDGQLLDGQHRLQAVVKSGCPMDTVVVTGVEPRAFVTFDTGLLRQAADMLREPDGSRPANGFRLAAVVRSYVAFRSNEGRLQGGRAGKDAGSTMQDLVHEYAHNNDLYNWAVAMAGREYQRLHLLTVAEIGGFSVYVVKDKKHTRAAVEEFWEAVMSGLGNFATHALHLRLYQSRTDRTKSLRPDVRVQLIIKAWNATVTGKMPKVLRWSPTVEEPQKVL